MRMSRCVSWAALAAALFGIGAAANAQINPAVDALLKQSTKAYAGMKSYQHTSVMVAKQGDRKQELKSTLALERPNKFRFTVDSQPIAAAVSDGKTFTNFRANGAAQEYVRKPAPAEYKDINIVDDVTFPPLATYLVAMMLQGNALEDKSVAQVIEHGKMAPSVTEGGKDWQVLSLPFNGPTGPPINFYFDKATHLLGKMNFKVPAQKVDVTETFENVQIDKPISDTVFAYTPPTDAKLVEKFTDPQAQEEQEVAALAAKYEGKPAPDFTLKDLNGKDVSLSSLKGKVVVVDFWASWCGPCRMVMPTIQEIHEKLADKGVEVLAVDTWDAAADGKTFLKENPKYTMHVLLDPAEKNAETSVATKLYGVHGIPTTLIIDKEGKVSKYIVGAHERDFYMSALKSLGIEIASR